MEEMYVELARVISYIKKIANPEQIILFGSAARGTMGPDSDLDILIVKKEFITDTSFSNIIFFDGDNWITPSTPLLEGTKRKELLEKNIISEQEIKFSDLKNFKKAILINAMLDFDEIAEIEIKNIFQDLSE